MDHQLCFLQHKNPTWLELDSDWLTYQAGERSYSRITQILAYFGGGHTVLVHFIISKHIGTLLEYDFWPPPQHKKNIFIHFWMNWDILMLFQFKCLKFIFFVKSSRIQGGEHAIRQIRFAWPNPASQTGLRQKNFQFEQN